MAPLFNSHFLHLLLLNLDLVFLLFFLDDGLIVVRFRGGFLVVISSCRGRFSRSSFFFILYRNLLFLRMIDIDREVRSE